MQPPLRDPVVDGRWAETEPEQLPARDDAMLFLCERPDC
jgi:hypothetical protein